MVPLLLQVVANAPAGRAVAATVSCADPRVHVRGAPADRWIEPVLTSCDELRTMADSDPSATIVIVGEGDDLLVEATLADGRTALRRVSSPLVLARTLEALVRLPPPVPSAPEPAAPTVAPAPIAPAAAPAQVSPPREAAVELGGFLGGRVAGSGHYTSAAPSAFAQLAVGAWAMGIEARWEAFEWAANTQPDFEMDTLAIGFAILRRLHLPPVNLDVGVAPRIVTETQANESQTGDYAFATTDFRFAGLVRAAFSRASALRPMVTVDGELSPSRLRRTVRLDPSLPPLPAWSAGIGLGLMWGEP